jgi:hypothetical protein
MNQFCLTVFYLQYVELCCMEVINLECTRDSERGNELQYFMTSLGVCIILLSNLFQNVLSTLHYTSNSLCVQGPGRSVGIATN